MKINTGFEKVWLRNLEAQSQYHGPSVMIILLCSPLPHFLRLAKEDMGLTGLYEDGFFTHDNSYPPSQEQTVVSHLHSHALALNYYVLLLHSMYDELARFFAQRTGIIVRTIDGPHTLHPTCTGIAQIHQQQRPHHLHRKLCS
jgi:hypothetical protein